MSDLVDATDELDTNYYMLPASYLAYLKATPVSEGGTLEIPSSELTKDYGSSTGYNLAISDCAYALYLDKLTECFPDYDVDVSGKLIPEILSSKMSLNNPASYKILQGICLEITSIMFCMNNDMSYFEFLSPRDVKRVRTNLSFMADWCSSYQEYRYLVRYLRRAEIDLGFIENFVTVLFNQAKVQSDLTSSD